MSPRRPVPPGVVDPMTPDPFDILGVAATFDLDPEALRRAYLARVREAHPDVAAPGADAHRRTALLNEAMRVLEDPERRADALLIRLGGPTREQEKGLPPAFLAEMMETRERIDEALASGDAVERERWAAWARRRREEHIRDAGRLLRNLPDPPTPEALRAVRVELNAWRYIERLIEHLGPTR